MPESHLWMVNHMGTVFTLGTSRRKFQQLNNTWHDSVNVKRLSASHWSAWAVGHDHRVYIYVISSDVPIRVAETTYENQRWSPIHGFSQKGLIKTDRYAWSNESGTVYRPKESVRLPSSYWEWEDDWLIDDNLRGEVIALEGWQYAFDFPASYTPEKHMNSFVRKRKWIRFRRFSSTDMWARISDMEVVEKTECFIDINVGGFLMPSQPVGFLSVWAITNIGHVYVRTNVNHDNPEGSTWQDLAPSGYPGIINISVGATNLVWAVTWYGAAMVRTEVSRNNIYGRDWALVEYPDDSTRLKQVCVGKNAVWALSREGQVWFRKGTSGDDMFWNQESALGTSWVEMVGEMSQIAVSSNDQVFAIDLNEKDIYFRTGVTSTDLTGKTWQLVSLHEDMTCLEREGLLSEGRVCSCGDPDVTCALHGGSRPRCSSTTTSTSSVSTVTNIEESSNEFVSPLQNFQPFPAYINDTLSIFHSDSAAWGSRQSVNNEPEDSGAFQPDAPAKDSTSCSPSSDVFLSPLADLSSIVIENYENSRSEARLQESLSSQTFPQDGVISSTNQQNICIPNIATQENVLPQTSTSSTTHPSLSSQKVFPDKISLIPITSPAANAGCRPTENISGELLLPAGNKSTNLISKVFPHKDADILRHIQAKDTLSPNRNKYEESSPSALKTTTSPVKCSMKVKVMGNSDCLNGDDEKHIKVSSCVPFSEVTVESVLALKTNADKVERMKYENTDFLSKSKYQQSELSSLYQISKLAANEQGNKDNQLYSAPDRVGLLSLPSPDAKIVKKDADPGLIQPVNFTTDNGSEAELGCPGEMSVLTEEKNHSSLPSFSTCYNVQDSLQECESHEKDKKHTHHKKKGRERRVKIVNSSHNDQNGDSILFRPPKTRKKRHDKLAANTNDHLALNDYVDINDSPTSDIADREESSESKDDLIQFPSKKNISGTELLSGCLDANIDSLDGPRSGQYSYGNYSRESSYKSLSPDSQAPFSNLSFLSGDYLTATQLNIESTNSQLTVSDTPQTNYMEMGKNETHKAFTTTQETTKASERADAEEFSPRQGIIPGVHDSVTKDDGCDSCSENLSNQSEISRAPSKVDSCCDKHKSYHLKGNTESNISLGEKSSLMLPCTYDISKNIPVPVHEHGELLTNCLTNLVTECNLKSQCYKNVLEINIPKSDSPSFKNNTISDVLKINIPSADSAVNLKDCNVNDALEISIPSADSAVNLKDNIDSVEKNTFSDIENTGVYNKSSVSNNNENENEILLCTGDHTYNKFASLDSTSSSDEIINFATDLLVSDDEKLDKINPVKDCTDQANLHSSETKNEHIGQSQIVFEPELSQENNSTQTCIVHSRSESSSLSSVARSSTEDLALNENSGCHAQAQNTVLPPNSLSLSGTKLARKTFKGIKSASPVFGDTLPMFSLTMSQPRLSWKWLDATSCIIDNPSTILWLSNTSKESDSRKKTVKVMKHLREDIMRKLQDRNRKQTHQFKHFEQAVGKTTWVKKAAMQMYLYGKKPRWVACSVELEQGISNLSEGCLTVHYQHRGTQKNIQIMQSEMTCVKMCSVLDTPSAFVVFTATTNLIHQPLILKATSENEAADWIGSLCAANASNWNMNCSISPGAIWACSFSGDVFVSTATSTVKNPSELCWGQHGGHLRLVETGPSGVTWALGFDRMPYVYNGGFGGAISAGLSEMSDNIQQIMDYHRVFVYENQKWFPVVGWCCKGIFDNGFHWLTESGRSVALKEEVKLPSSKCQWISDWAVDFSTPGGVDTTGWQYSSQLFGPFSPRQHLRSSYRRRRWVRRYKIILYGPWQTAGSLGLADLSIQIDPVTSTTDPIIMWAVGANGDVLIRNGVTISNPKGQSWIHVATHLDKPFRSISVGGSYSVWGIAGDGSAWFRPGVRPNNPAGTCWLQVVPPPPGNFLLHQVSAGATTVWAVDTGDNLWRRENITPTFPEGTGWEMIASRVKRVSVGPGDQVWIIANASFNKMKHGTGVIYRRVGITSAKPSGTDWEVVIGNGWAHVSVRGVSEVKLEESLSLDEKENTKS